MPVQKTTIYSCEACHANTVGVIRDEPAARGWFIFWSKLPGCEPVAYCPKHRNREASEWYHNREDLGRAAEVAAEEWADALVRQTMAQWVKRHEEEHARP